MRNLGKDKLEGPVVCGECIASLVVILTVELVEVNVELPDVGRSDLPDVNLLPVRAHRDVVRHVKPLQHDNRHHFCCHRRAEGSQFGKTD